MRTWKSTCVAIGVACTMACAMVTGCGDDDVGPKTDGGTNVPDGPKPPPPPPPDGGPGLDSSRPDGTGPDGGPCDFADFVKNLIATQTTATSVPSTDLGAACTDKADPTQFAPLFP